MESVKYSILAAAVVGVISTVAQAAPPLSGNLVLSQTITVQDDVSPVSGGGSNYNPRIYGSKNYVAQINPSVFGRYAAGTNTPEAAVNLATERRMLSPLGGAAGSTYMLLAGGASSPGSAATNYTFTQYDWNGTNPVSATPFASGTVSNASFDWIDTDTLIAATYQPGADRGKLYMIDITATGPSFAMALNNSLLGGSNNKVTSSPYIRNVTVGDVYNGYAYYGNGAAATAGGYTAGFYALDLSTGVETPLGSLAGVGNSTNGDYAGIWSVTERGGYLYVVTTDNGIQVYNMTNGNTIGSLYTTYTDAELNTLTSNASLNFYGFDVAPDGSRMLLSGSNATWEIVPEPASLGLIGLGVTALLRRRK